MPFVISVIKCFAHWIVWIITKAFIIAVKSNIIRIMHTVIRTHNRAIHHQTHNHMQTHIGHINNIPRITQILFTIWRIANHNPIYRNRALISYECISGECVMMRLIRPAIFHHFVRFSVWFSSQTWIWFSQHILEHTQKSPPER